MSTRWLPGFEWGLLLMVHRICRVVTVLLLRHPHTLLQEFKTVMSALKSNNERWGIKDVTLVFRKPTADEVSLCVKSGAGA